MLARAISIAADVFKNTKDKGGRPYILHCLRVMSGVNQNDEELMIIAVLRDVAEDFPDVYPISRFLRMAFRKG